MAEKEKQFKVIWNSEDSIPVYYANHLSVSFAGGTEFHITFGHLSPPIGLGLPDVDLPDELEIKTVSRIVASPDVMKKFVEILKDNMDNFDRLIKEDDKDE